MVLKRVRNIERILPVKRFLIMQSLTKQVLEHAARLAVARRRAYGCQRTAVPWRSRKVRPSAFLPCAAGTLLRAGRGIYVRPIESRFGSRAPSAFKMIEGLAAQRGETIVSHDAAAANALDLSTRVLMRAVYLTSGRSRHLKLGAQTVKLRHAPVWQLIFLGRAAGEVVRALAWLGPDKAAQAIHKLRSKLPSSELEEVASARAHLPTWTPVCALPYPRLSKTFFSAVWGSAQTRWIAPP